MRYILALSIALAQAVEDWPADLPKPEMSKYTPTQVTQAIATTNNRPSIDRVSRFALEAHWHQPGGLQDVPRELWSSEVYKWVPGDARPFLARLPVKNSFGFFQYELGYTRSYPVGTFFCDVLRNRRGKIFEIRFREKTAEGWENTIAYRHRAARPVGFFNIKTRQCVACHNDATGPGSGNYGLGLVPGSDTVFSDGFPALEGR